MFEGASATSSLDNPDLYSRFRTDFGNTEPSQSIRQGIAFDFIAAPPIKNQLPQAKYKPGLLIGPTNITEQVIVDLKRLETKLSLDGYISREDKKLRRAVKGLRAGFPKFRLLKKALHHTLLLAALASVSLGVYLSFTAWWTNSVSRAQAAKLTKQVASSTTTGSSSSNVPSSVKPSSNTVADYVVAPGAPKYLDIPKISVHSRILSLGIAKDGALATPNNIYDTGWYDQSAKPGQAGAMLIDGHISTWQAHGVFYGLNKLASGDTMSVIRGDGQTYNYQVVKTSIYPANQVDMSSLLVSQDPNQPGLNLISCTGEVIPGTNEFNQRLVVYTVQI